MSIDSELPSVTQTDLAPLLWSGRLASHAWVVRTVRHRLGGGFGDQDKFPYSWQVRVDVDRVRHIVHSARGAPREWNSLDRLERWLREQGFRSFSVENEIEPVEPAGEPDADAAVHTSFIK